MMSLLDVLCEESKMLKLFVRGCKNSLEQSVCSVQKSLLCGLFQKHVSYK